MFCLCFPNYIHKQGGSQMRFTKIVMSFFALLCTLVIPLSSVSAHEVDLDGWQLRTSEWVHYNKTLNNYITGVDNAHIKGNVLICNRSSYGKYIYFYVKEYDPGSNKDEIVTYAGLEPTLYTDSTRCLKLNVSNFVDGDNKEAEIYIQTTSKDVHFAIYD